MFKHLLVETSATTFTDFSVMHFDSVSVTIICIFKDYCHRWSCREKAVFSVLLDVLVYSTMLLGMSACFQVAN